MAAAMSGSLFAALDLPPEAHALQDAYWKAKHEWEALAASYEAALGDLLRRLDDPGPQPGDNTVLGR